jgi:UTP--glucose-1-phosphate uridylyltransferase
MEIRKAVIPAAGLGTRFLPVTKALPKELLPILDKPMLQYVVEEAAEAGIQEIILVVSPDKGSVAEYFQPQPALETRLRESGAPDLADKVNQASHLAQVSAVIQERPLGLGHAVLMAEEAVGQEPFVVILPDDIIVHSPGALAQMLDVYQNQNQGQGGGVVAVEAVEWDAVHNYGVVDAAPVSERVGKIQGVVEKPPREEAPSNLAIVGRYILPCEIFECLRRTPPGALGEIQLTDGLLLLLKSQPLFSYRFLGRRYDGGRPLGLLRAALDFGLEREDTRDGVLAMLSELGQGGPAASQ